MASTASMHARGLHVGPYLRKSSCAPLVATALTATYCSYTSTYRYLGSADRRPGGEAILGSSMLDRKRIHRIETTARSATLPAVPGKVGKSGQSRKCET
jgi:hypothetical protein